MRPRTVIPRAQLVAPRDCQARARNACIRSIAYHTHINASSRPNLPFLAVPVSNRSAVRSFTTERKQWLKHEVKLAVRYTLSFWGIVACFGVIGWFVNEELLERDFPTPHEWGFLLRKCLRDANSWRAPRNGEVVWPEAFEVARTAVLHLEDPKWKESAGVVKLSDQASPDDAVAGEFAPCDISTKSEEWRRGYYEAIMLAAKAAEHCNGYVRDVTRNLISPPQFVIGPSNPRPDPVPPGQARAPREEDCEIAFPSAHLFYTKIIATEGFTPRQKMQAALEWASFMEFDGMPEGAAVMYKFALEEATQGVDTPSNPPYSPKTFVLNEEAGLPSQNILDSLTAIANYKARNGNVAGALPIYLSLLQARRRLSSTPPPGAPSPKPTPSPWNTLVNFLSQPPYPAPPPDGTQPPWRSPAERCQEASLSLYIGEILFASSSREDGLSWTRESVDLAEEQLRALSPLTDDGSARKTCRECLGAGLDNWSQMVAKLVKDEEARREKGSGSSGGGVFSFWSASQPSPEGRWTAEYEVVKERMRRTKELLEDVKPGTPTLSSIIKPPA